MGRLLVALFLVPALVLTVLRIVQPEFGLAVRLVSFAPLAIVLYGFVVLFCIVRVLLPGRGRWQVDAATAIVALLLLGLHAWWLSPQFVGPHPTAAADAVPLRVLTVNLYRGQADAPAVLDKAVRQKVDVLVLEEVTPGILADLREAGLDEAFPHSGGRPAEQIAGTMVFAAAPISEVTRLSTNFGSWSMTVSLPQGDVTVFAVHPRPPKGSAGQWADDLAAIADAIEADQPDIVAGDFNATRDHRQFQRLLDAGTVDAAERLNTGWQPTWPANGEFHVLGLGLPRLVQIDHVLIGPRFAAVGVRTVALDNTDHSGVLAEVALR
ncbi:endonuclease/exonuclease/phosphatase family protein [Nocardioides sp.]|uniref:endonuclease/exonuclease/phosphatase family protein n=1 Tax=Nocardioides sp. TaxID=35761 RepID=UPI003D099641